MITDNRMHKLHDDILDLFHATISRFPPQHAPFIQAAMPYKIGEYLVELGYITPRELRQVLQHAKGAHHVGLDLVKGDVIPAPVLPAILLIQFLDRIERESQPTPRFMGERLLLNGLLEARQLADGLGEQIATYQHGDWVRLGEILTHRGWLAESNISN